MPVPLDPVSRSLNTSVALEPTFSGSVTKLRGGGLSDLPATPSPSPLAPWQTTQFLANEARPFSRSPGVFGGAPAAMAAGATSRAAAAARDHSDFKSIGSFLLGGAPGALAAPEARVTGTP